MRQLRVREREDCKHGHEPKQQKAVERVRPKPPRKWNQPQKPTRERQQDDRQHHEVIAGKAGVAVLDSAEATDIVVQEEASEEPGPIVQIDRQIPGPGDQEEHQPAKWRDHRPEPVPEAPQRREVGQAHDQREEHGDRPLGQKAERKPQVDAQQRAACRPLRIAIDVEKRQRNEQVQHRVGHRRLCNERDLYGEREREAGRGRRRGIRAGAHEEPKRQHPKARRDCRRQPQRRLRQPQQLH